MASSQVEISSSASSPFGCVLRDRREPNNVFRTNLKTLVMDHHRLNDCISVTPPPNHNFPLPKKTAPRDDDRGTSKLGASSLVQIWEKRLNVVSGLNVNVNATSNANACPSKQAVEDTEQQQQQADLESEEDGFADWHFSSPPSSTQSQSSDAGEKERVRVVDIIRRLTLTAEKPPPHSSSNSLEDNDHSINESSSSSSSSSSHPILILREQHLQPKCLAHVLCSPRIRGRQAFADLLLKIERDRRRELDTLVNRRAVSKFTQRGRIQSLLRLKILKRGMALEDEQHRPQFVITPREQYHKSTTIMHLRERFSRVCENDAISPLGDMLSINNNDDDDKTRSNTNTNTNDDDRSQSDTDTQATNTNDNDNHNQQQVVDIHCTSSIDTAVIPGDVQKQIEEREKLYPPGSNSEVDTPNLSLKSQDSINGWEDNEAAEESYDWFTDISRPRSYWEDRRQTWYQQMLNSNSASDEIRQLIQRKTVSNFLSSDLCEIMDKLMVSRLEGRRQTVQQREEIDEEDDGTEEELWCFSPEGNTQPKSSDNEEEDERSNARDHEASDYLDPNLQLAASPSILSSWSYQDNEMGEDSNGGASTSSPQPQFSSNNQRSSAVSTTHISSIEMELIYDLRGHMEQMYQEMSELRKSIKCCMDMQQLIMLQQSMKPEVVAGGRGGIRKPKKSIKQKCCICYDMEIDSLLYRCGHMCSCMKCGKELQWKGGKCPICRAPIEDVVRASFTTHSS